ncbi:MAG TPA: MurT ligase domain-containing protein [Herpetosiphonaceae bacterium]
MTFPLRRVAATIAGKAAMQLSRRLGTGGGTQLPGVVARRVAPAVLHDLASALPRGVVLVTGTNGKTTTARMLAAILKTDGLRLLHNRAGANLITGLTATAVAGADLWGRPRADIGLFETDEAHLPAAIRETQPRVVLMLNLFRDQLDRYGEVDTIARKWQAALETLPPTSTVVLNADDPAIAYLGESLRCKVRYFGLQDLRYGIGGVQHMADSQFCRRCGTAYVYNPAFYGHIGHYRCPNCGLQRPTPNVRLERLTLKGITGAHLVIADDEGGFDVQLPVPGLYNALNALAAAAAALALDVPPAGIRNALEGFTAAFGRIERIPIAGRDVLMALIKNPVGASETVRMLVTRDSASETESAPADLYLLIVINDKIADGTDVSWLWDADFEQLAGRVAHVVVSGTRAADMAVRLKYAGVPHACIEQEPNLGRALDRVLAASPAEQPLYLLPTYTAMLELREELVQRGLVKPFWED